MIKATAVFTTASVVVTLVYAIAFRWTYPLVEMDTNTYAFLGFCGVLSCGLAVGLWHLLQRVLPSTKP